MSSEPKTTYSVCLYHEGLAAPFAKFREVFWPSSGESKIVPQASERAALSSTGDRSPQPPPTFLFLKNSEVLGHISSLPIAVWFQGRSTPAYWVVGFMVLPEYRGGPVGVSIIKKVNETLPLAMTLTVEQAPLRIFKGLGWTHLGLLPQYLLVLRPRKLLNNVRVDRVAGSRGEERGLFRLLVGGLRYAIIREAAAALCWGLFHGLGWRRIFPKLTRTNVREAGGFDEESDDLWERMKLKYPALVVRDRAYLSSRYGNHPGRYRVLFYRENERLEGFLVLSIKQFDGDPRMGSSRVGTIIDCLFDPCREEIFASFLAEAIQVFHRDAVDAVLCTASYAPLRAMLKRYGFVSIPGNLNFVFHDKSGTIDIRGALDSWHFMRGDCDADGNF